MGKRRKMKLSECLQLYLDKNSNYLKERTKFCYQNRVKKLLKIFNDIEIEQFTQDFLQDFITKQQKEYKRKATAIKNDLTLLISALKPYYKFDKFRYLIEDVDLQEKKIYSKEDIEKLEDYILKHTKLTLSPIMIAINTGLRLTEIIGLKWSDIDFNNKEISIRRNSWIIKGNCIESTPKTKSGARTIPINLNLYNYLSKIKQEDKNLYIITGKDKTKDQRSIQKTNQRLCKKLGINYCGFHAYRHAFATRLLEKSQDFKSISEIMGHSNISITQNIYNHPSEEQRKKVIEMAFEDKNQQQGFSNNEQIKILQDQINELRTIIARLTQYVKDNLKQNQEQKYYNNELVTIISRSNGIVKIRDKAGKEKYINENALSNNIVKVKYDYYDYF